MDMPNCARAHNGKFDRLLRDAWLDEVMSTASLPPNSKLAATVMERIAVDGMAAISTAELCAALSASPKTTLLAVQRLEDRGFIRIIDRKGRPARVYGLMWNGEVLS